MCLKKLWQDARILTLLVKNNNLAFSQHERDNQLTDGARSLVNVPHEGLHLSESLLVRRHPLSLKIRAPQ